MRHDEAGGKLKSGAGNLAAGLAMLGGVRGCFSSGTRACAADASLPVPAMEIKIICSEEATPGVDRGGRLNLL